MSTKTITRQMLRDAGYAVHEGLEGDELAGRWWWTWSTGGSGIDCAPDDFATEGEAWDSARADYLRHRAEDEPAEAPSLRTVIEIDMGNAAFEDDNGSEVARLLRWLARKIEWCSLGAGCSYALYDINGNRVGEMRVESS